MTLISHAHKHKRIKMCKKCIIGPADRRNGKWSTKLAAVMVTNVEVVEAMRQWTSPSRSYFSETIHLHVGDGKKNIY